MIINPCANHVRVLLVEVNAGRLSMEKNWLIVANLISCQSGRPVKKHLTPKVGVRARLVHCGIRLEVFLNVELVLLKHGVNFLIIIGIEDLFEVSSNTVLLVMEAIDVRTADCKHVLGKELSHHSPNECIIF